MPKKKVDPKETPEAQHKRFKEAAREHEADESGKEFDRAFKKIVPPQSPAPKSAKS
jgi:hypothetical protein